MNCPQCGRSMTDGGKTDHSQDFYCPGGHKVRVSEDVMREGRDLRDGAPGRDGEWLVYTTYSFGYQGP